MYITQAPELLRRMQKSIKRMQKDKDYNEHLELNGGIYYVRTKEVREEMMLPERSHYLTTQKGHERTQHIARLLRKWIQSTQETIHRGRPY